MRATRRFFAASITTIGLVTGLAACSNSSSSTTDSEAASAGSNASGDETLVIYSGRSEDLIAPLIKKFEETSGIKTEVRYGKTAEQAQLLLTEGEKTPAQVFLSQEAGALGLVGDQGLLAPLPAEVLDLVPTNYNSSEKEWVGITGRARTVAYNTDKVSESDAPETIKRLC